jgi:hypothetical protein
MARDFFLLPMKEKKKDHIHSNMKAQRVRQNTKQKHV